MRNPITSSGKVEVPKPLSRKGSGLVGEDAALVVWGVERYGSKKRLAEELERSPSAINQAERAGQLSDGIRQRLRGLQAEAGGGIATRSRGDLPALEVRDFQDVSTVDPFPRRDDQPEIVRRSDNPDPTSYALVIAGNSLSPRFLDGDILEVVTTAQVKTGNYAVILHRDGRRWVRRVLFSGRRKLIGLPNGSEDAITLERSEVALHKIVSIRARGMY